MAIDQLFDVSVTFPGRDAAVEAYTRVFGAPPGQAPVAFGQLTVLSSAVDTPMPLDLVDLRLCPEGFDLGTAFVGLKLGVMDAFSLRRMAGPVDQFAPDGGRMREASRLVTGLLQHGGTAVVLHKAAGTVKPAARFLGELRDVRAADIRPWAAWLDFLASREGEAFTARSYGLPHYFGGPNVAARLVAAEHDAFALERLMQAVRYAAATLAAGPPWQAPPARLEVPIGWYPGPRAPTLPAPSATTFGWDTTLVDEGLRLELTCPDFGTQHIAARWDAAPEEVPGDLYERALEELLLRRLARDGFSYRDTIDFEARAGLPAVSVFSFQREDGVTLFITCGVGRHRAPAGTEALATQHAEFCVAVQRDESRFQRVLLHLAQLSLQTTAPGGLKDFDGLPPSAPAPGFVVTPMEDLRFGQRPLALRQFVPVTEEEYAVYRTLDFAGRRAWTAERTASWPSIAARWK
jgi:hypothetical protein